MIARSVKVAPTAPPILRVSAYRVLQVFALGRSFGVGPAKRATVVSEASGGGLMNGSAWANEALGDGPDEYLAVGRSRWRAARR